MNDAESVLARWSRRKREAAAPAELAKPAPANADEGAVSPAEPEEPVALELPPIESIESASDITAFLAPGVPLELTRAALRRAWTADPAIRDFIGLSENAWDFNAPDGVPGFGTLDLDQVQSLLEQILGEPKPTNATIPAVEAPGQPSPAAENPAAPAVAAGAEPPTPVAATVPEEAAPKPREPAPLRRHGGALPQ